MEIQLCNKSSCKYDQISLGEVMLRLDSGEGSICTAAIRPMGTGLAENVMRRT